MDTERSEALEQVGAERPDVLVIRKFVRKFVKKITGKSIKILRKLIKYLLKI